jgi:putative flippase GtrA
MAMSLGAGINYAVFSLLVSAVPVFHAYPKLAVAAAAIAGLFFNFPMSKYFVFRQRVSNPTRAGASSLDP